MTENKNQPLSQKEIIKKIQEIYQDFLSKIQKIQSERDKKIIALFKKAEQRQIEEIRKKLK